MARLESVAVAGFFPTPPDLLPPIAALLRFPEKSEEERANTYTRRAAWFVDPCAGEGEAVYALADAAKEAGYEVEVRTCEMERSRATILQARAGVPEWQRDQRSGVDALRADAFRVRFGVREGHGASVLYLNPPYDADPEHGRLEQRFLARFAPVLAPGGLLLLVVPHASLSASAGLLASEFDVLSCHRFPAPHFAAYRQVVLVARRLAEPRFAPDEATRRRVELLAEDPGPRSLVLGDGPAHDVPVWSRWEGGVSTWEAQLLDVGAVAAAYRPHHRQSRSGALSPMEDLVPPGPVQDSILRRYPVATPPRPAHIAAGIAAGVFNGSRISPTAPGLPDLLVKGVFDREYRTIEQKKGKDGEVRGEVQVQQPKLTTTVLDLSTYRYHRLADEATGSAGVEGMGVPDLLDRYGAALAGVMAANCPVLYDPRRDACEVVLPRLARPLFAAQAHAARALVKLLGGQRARRSARRGRAAYLLGEIGCLGLGTLVLRSDGTQVPVEDVRVGDSLMGPEGRPRTVVRTIRGRSQLFRIVPTVGEPWICNDDHVLTLVHTMSDDVFDVPLREYLGSRRLRRKLTLGGRTTHPREEFKQFFPERGIDFPVIDAPPIDPYFLGVWYGDGSHGSEGVAGVHVTKPDPEILACVREIADEFDLRVTTRRDLRTGCPTHSIVGDKWKRNPLTAALRAVYGDGTNLPASCVRGSRDVRRAFLAGFLDTDGHYATGCFEIAQKRRPWADGICFVARSLGIRATMSEKVVNGESYWRIMLSGDFTQLPIRIARKVPRPRPASRSNRDGDPGAGRRRMRSVSRTGIGIEPIGEGEYAGFTLDGDGRFLLGDFTVTHNSGKTGVALAAARAIGARTVLVVCPPHLLRSWAGEAAAVVPEAEVRVLADVGDVDDLARAVSGDRSPETHRIAVMSREAAKLGHALEGVHACPRCGGAVPEGVDLARKRARCELRPLRPADRLADLAVRLALVLEPCAPGSEVVAAVLPGRSADARRALYAARPEPRAFSPALLVPLLPDLDAALGELLSAEARDGEEQKKRHRAAALLLHAAADGARLAYAARLLLCSDDYAGRDAGRELARLLPRDLRLVLAAEDREANPDGGYFSSDYGDRGGWRALEKRVAEDEAGGRRADLYRLGVGYLRIPGGVEVDGLPGTIAAALAALGSLARRARWEQGPPCGEHLYQAVPEPRRLALGNYVARRHPRLFDLLVADEAHEYNAGSTSAQGIVMQRLIGTGVPTLLMTGSVMNGYAESLFSNQWSASPTFRAEFALAERTKFVERYGYRKRLVEDRDKDSGKVVEFGAVSDRVVRSERVIGQAPGVLPLFLFRHLLRQAVTLHKSDLALDLPECRQERVEVDPSPEQAREYRKLLDALKTRIRADQFDPILAGKLFGQLAELPSYLDRATSDVCGPEGFRIRYPDSVGGVLVAAAAPIDSSVVLPKEERMLAIIREELAAGRRAMVFAWHVALLPRLRRLIEAEIGGPAPILSADRVPPAKRQEWIDREVVAPGRRVMLANPVAIQTGLNNLVHFSTEVWVENPACNPIVRRQAVGRVDRIGQRHPTRIVSIVYRDTLQTTLEDLLMRKVAVSTAADGMDPESALAATGIGEDDALAGLSVGRQIWKMISGDP